MQDRHEARDFRPVTDVIGRIAGFALAVYNAVHAGVHKHKGSERQVMHKGDALAGDGRGHPGQHDVVVNQRRSVANFDKHIV